MCQIGYLREHFGTSTYYSKNHEEKKKSFIFSSAKSISSSMLEQCIISEYPSYLTCLNHISLDIKAGHILDILSTICANPSNLQILRHRSLDVHLVEFSSAILSNCPPAVILIRKMALIANSLFSLLNHVPLYETDYDEMGSCRIPPKSNSLTDPT